MKTILVIAGSDTSGGAGIQADIKTGSSLDVHVMTAITAITAQNSTTIKSIYEVPPEFVACQIKTVLEDILPHGIKIGMLYTASVIRETARIIREHGLGNVVIDPVLSSSTGIPLLQRDAMNALIDLIHYASLITPNIDEAEAITGKKIFSVEDMKICAKELKSMGPDIVITGGHMDRECIDIFYDGKDFHEFKSSKIPTRHTHGTGCVFSTALTAFVAKGYGNLKAVDLARSFVRNAIKNAYECGKGSGPVRPKRLTGPYQP